MPSKIDMKMAENMYSNFVTFAKWGTLSAVIVAAFVVLIIS